MARGMAPRGMAWRGMSFVPLQQANGDRNPAHTPPSDNQAKPSPPTRPAPRPPQPHPSPIPSPVVRAETLRFKEEGVFGVIRDVFLPWYNAYRWGGG